MRHATSICWTRIENNNLRFLENNKNLFGVTRHLMQVQRICLEVFVNCVQEQVILELLTDIRAKTPPL